LGFLRKSTFQNKPSPAQRGHYFLAGVVLTQRNVFPPPIFIFLAALLWYQQKYGPLLKTGIRSRANGLPCPDVAFYGAHRIKHFYR
jgi:hypothetical protein